MLLLFRMSEINMSSKIGRNQSRSKKLLVISLSCRPLHDSDSWWDCPENMAVITSKGSGHHEDVHQHWIIEQISVMSLSIFMTEHWRCESLLKQIASGSDSSALCFPIFLNPQAFQYYLSPSSPTGKRDKPRLWTNIIHRKTLISRFFLYYGKK